MPSRKLVVEIVGDSSSLERAFSRSAKSARRFNVGIGTLLKSAVVFRAANEAMTGLSNAVGGSISEFASQQKVAAQTNAVLKSTAGIANVTAARVNKLAGAIQSYSGIDDEAIVAGENLILTFKNIRNEVGKGNAIFDRATKAAVDLSVAGFGSLESTSKQLGKALNDPVRGMTALGRAGVTFSEGQKETIKQLVKTGKTLDAQKLILKEVTSQVGGSARAFGKTIPGALARTSEAFKNMGGAIVGAVAPAFAKLANLVASELPKIEAGVSAFVDRLKAARTITAKIEVVFETVGNLAVQAAKIAREILVRIGEALAQIDWRVVGERISQGLVSALDAITAFVRSVDWAKVGGAIVSGIADFLKGVDWVGLFKSIVKLWVAALKAAAKLLVGAAHELGKQIVQGVGDGLDSAKDFVIKKLLEFVNKIIGITGFLGRFDPFKGVRKKVQEQLKGMEGDVAKSTAKIQDVVAKTPPGQVAIARDSQQAAVAREAQAAARRAEAIARAAQEKADAEADKVERARLAKLAAAAKVRAKELQARAKELQAAADALAKRQIENERKRNQRIVATRKSSQFKALGLTGAGEERVPGVAALKKRGASLSDQIKGTALDTPKVRSKLAAIAKVLAQGYRKVGKDVREAILQMLNDISGALSEKGSKQGPLTKTTGLNSKKFLAGMGLSPEEIRELRGRLSSFNSAGMGMAGSQTRGTGGFTGGAVVVENYVTVQVGDQKLAAVVMKQEQKTRRRNPRQKRGPNRMTGGV